MNRVHRRAMSKPCTPGRSHGPVRIPKLVIQDRDFHQIDLLMLKLAKGEVEVAGGRIVMRNMQGELYCVLTALEGWMDYWRGIAAKAGIAFDDGLCMTNLFAFRATDPKDMKAAADPIGPENDAHLLALATEAGVIVAAWGANGTHTRRRPIRHQGRQRYFMRNIFRHKRVDH